MTKTVKRAVTIFIDSFGRKTSKEPEYVPTEQQRQDNLRHYQCQYDKQSDLCLKVIHEVASFLDGHPITERQHKLIDDLLIIARLHCSDLRGWAEAIEKEKQALEGLRFKQLSVPTT